MRLDLFLKWSRVILRRTLAKASVMRAASASTALRLGQATKFVSGDTIEVRFHAGA